MDRPLHCRWSLTVRRFDAGGLASPVRLPNGYLRCDAHITRVGVFTYRNADGTERRELRTPANVFKADALASFGLVPLTNNHPHEELTDKNTRKFSVGIVSGVHADDSFVRATVQIMDEDAIREAEAGKTELSCGYNCDLEMTPGVTRGIPGVEDGLKYDAIQTNITGNHVALVHRGRAGNDASLRLDASDAVMIQDSAPGDPAVKGRTAGHGNPKENGTMKLTIDGVTVEVDEQAAQIINKGMKTRDDRIAHLDGELETAKASSETEKARADKATEDLETEKKAREDEQAPEKLDERVKERLELVRTHETILGKETKDGQEYKLDEMSDDELKRDVVLHVNPGAAELVKDCTDVYLQARYDAAVETSKETREDESGAAFGPIHHADAKGSSGKRTDAAAARDRMIQRGRDAYKGTPKRDQAESA